MRITDVAGLHLRVPMPDVARMDPTAEVLIVCVETDAGTVGLAECNHAPGVARAFLEARGTQSMGVGVRSLLVGREVADHTQIMDELYGANAFAARRGVGLAVLHAIDACLWDLVAQERGVPLWRLLWGEDATAVQPYVTIYTGQGAYKDSRQRLQELLESSLSLGYRAVKLEPLADCVPEEKITDFVAAGRRTMGDDLELLVDFGHRFTSPALALRAIEEIAEHRPTLIETPLFVDDLWAYRKLVTESPVPIAASELYESYWDFRALVEIGQIGVVQPWPNRMGVTDTRRVIELARVHGRGCVLAGWNATPVGVALGVHLAAGLGSRTAMEHPPTSVYGFSLRGAASPDPAIVDGHLALPSEPGLGVHVDHAAAHRYLI